MFSNGDLSVLGKDIVIPLNSNSTMLYGEIEIHAERTTFRKIVTGTNQL